MFKPMFYNHMPYLNKSLLKETRNECVWLKQHETCVMVSAVVYLLYGIHTNNGHKTENL